MKFSDSLKKNKDFDAVYKAGNSKANRDFVMYIKNNDKETNRLGISVSKKVGNSVVRHHLARLIREAYRLHEEMFNSGLDIVVVVRPAAKEISYDQTVKSPLHLANLHHITINN
jgi:ribonuclease P protein component